MDLEKYKIIYNAVSIIYYPRNILKFIYFDRLILIITIIFKLL